MKTVAAFSLLAIGAIAQDLGKSPVPFGPKPAGCSAFEILVARGTSEPGPFGLVVGDPLVANVMKAMPGARGYAVQYPADISDMSIPTGVTDIGMRLAAQSTACPMQKFALVGYSQGATVMRGAAAKLPMDLQMKVLAVVAFGDPGLAKNAVQALPPMLQTKLWENCAIGDPVCGADATMGFGPHLTYSDPGTPYQMDSMNFIVAAFKGTPMPARTSAPVPGQAAPVSAKAASMSMSEGMTMTMPGGMTMTMGPGETMSMGPGMTMPMTASGETMSMSMGKSMSGTMPAASSKSGSSSMTGMPAQSTMAGGMNAGVVTGPSTICLILAFSALFLWI